MRNPLEELPTLRSLEAADRAAQEDEEPPARLTWQLAKGVGEVGTTGVTCAVGYRPSRVRPAVSSVEALTSIGTKRIALRPVVSAVNSRRVFVDVPEPSSMSVVAAVRSAMPALCSTRISVSAREG